MMPFLLAGFKKILSTGKKVFLVVAAFVIVISLFSYFLNKDKASLQSSQIDPIKKNREEIYKFINDPKLKSTKEGKLSITAYRTTMCGMIGEGCTDNPADGDKNFDKSTFGFVSKLFVFPIVNPPASGIYWVYSGLQSAGFIPKTYASEGIGFAAMEPFSNLWKIFRDFSYMILVIILIAIGFMVMFRMKMNPQTVISVENALPRIVIALILITFSFAIAGFIIDLTYILIGLIVSILSKNPTGGTYFDATTFKNQYMLSGGWDIITRDARVRFGGRSIGVALGSAFLQVMPITLNTIARLLSGGLAVYLTKWLITMATNMTSSAVGLENVGILGTAIGGVLKGIAGLNISFLLISTVFLLGYTLLLPAIMWLLIGFSILFLSVRLFALIFSNYLKLIVNIIIAPLLLMTEAVPGRSAFKYWILNIISCLIAYPIMIGVFVLSYLIVFQTGGTDMTARLPYLSGIDSDSFRLLIGLGLIFLIPDFVKTAKEALGIKELPFNIGVGTFFGGVTAGVGGATGLLGQVGTVSLGLTAFSKGGGIGQVIEGIKGNLGKAIGKKD
jgi:hypothetical protein